MTMQEVRVRQTTARPVTDIHRRTLRQIPRWLLEEACAQLALGRSEWFVCITLGVSPEVMEGALSPAVREALWERGYFSDAAWMNEIGLH